MKRKTIVRKITSAALLLHLGACARMPEAPPVIPSEDYVRELKARAAEAPIILAAAKPDSRARMRFIDGETGGTSQQDMIRNDPGQEIVTDGGIPGVQMYRSSASLTRDYQGPLDLGDPGVQSSLWRESRGANDMLRDDRAWQAGDLITISVTENDQGIRQAQTNTKSESSIGAALTHFFGIGEVFHSEVSSNEGGVGSGTLLEASSNQEFKGQGLTNRTNQLRGRLSVMVAEVLPTGILRIEGKKIVSVNDEEQIMMLSGLVRLRDINSLNEVDSSKVANMRIDYYGKGTLDEAQTPGWGSRLIKTVWPF